MKKILCLATVAALLFTACKKDKEQTTQERLQGSWKIESSILKVVVAGTPNTSTYAGQPTDYVDFRTDGKVYTSVNGSLDTANYTVSANQVTTTDTYPGATPQVYNLTTLTEVVAQLYNRSSPSTTDYTEITLNLKR